jgi:hypothetical protein
MSFLGICGHFVDVDGRQLRKALLGLRPVITHGGAKQATLLVSTLCDYGITAKIGYIIHDNHGSNDNDTLHALNAHLLEEHIDLDPVHHRLRCIGHVLNLAVVAFLFESLAMQKLMKQMKTQREEMAATEPRGKKSGGKASWRRLGLLGKLYNIAIFIQSSVPRYDDFNTALSLSAIIVFQGERADIMRLVYRINT